MRPIFFRLKTVLFTALAGLFANTILPGAAGAAEYLVHSPAEFRQRVSDLAPGDTVRLANGTWRDFEIRFSGQGTAEQPITLAAEEFGQVIISGVSDLKLSGTHLVVAGLVFRDGHAPGDSVIAFRTSPDQVATHSRVTQTVIDGFNKPARAMVDSWVSMYGRHNRFDHGHLEGKGNKGVTLEVVLDREADRENHHCIDHNYFGPRPVLGANGGETIRIGNSWSSRSDSLTRVENNYFFHASGEHEIISNKSGGNLFRGNVFDRSQGTLTLRHGHGNRVENNVFFGHGVPHTGGIRVINRDQVVRNNYMEDLAGFRFRGALVMMNGIPDGPLNRYDPVENARVEHNSVINSRHIAFGAGHTGVINAAPTDSHFSDNLVYNDDGRDILEAYADTGGITFSGNVLNDVVAPAIERGFRSQSITLERAANGLLYPRSDALAGVGVSRELQPVRRDQVGMAWYPKKDPQQKFASGTTLTIEPGDGVLQAAVARASSGDRIVLLAGEYLVRNVLVIDKPLTLQGTGDVRVAFTGTALFEIVDGGGLDLQGLDISGEHAPDYAGSLRAAIADAGRGARRALRPGGNAVIRTSPYSMLTNYEIRIRDCDFRDLDGNPDFNFLVVAPDTLADHIEITGSTFRDLGGALLKLDPNRLPRSLYSVEHVTIRDSRFHNIQGALVEIFSEAGESAFGPHFSMTGSVLDNVGRGERNLAAASVYLHGVTQAYIEDNHFTDSAGILVDHLIGMPITRITGNTFERTPAPKTRERYYDQESTAVVERNTAL